MLVPTYWLLKPFSYTLKRLAGSSVSSISFGSLMLTSLLFLLYVQSAVPSLITMLSNRVSRNLRPLTFTLPSCLMSNLLSVLTNRLLKSASKLV